MSLLDKDGKPVPKPVVVAICIPAGDQCATGFAYDLAKLVGFMAAACPTVRILAYLNRGTILPEQRHQLVRQALAHDDLTHILWLDSDMRFPKDALIKLLGHGVPIVGANYATRRAPVIPTTTVGTEGELLFSAPEDTDLVDITRMGMGLMLVSAEVYKTIPAPWFAVGYNKTEDAYAGEDVFFCNAAHRAGFDVLVDPSLSREVAHLGEFEYKMHHAEVTRDHWLAEHQKEVTHGT